MYLKYLPKNTIQLKKELVILMAWGLERFISSITDDNILPANEVLSYFNILFITVIRSCIYALIVHQGA